MGNVLQRQTKPPVNIIVQYGDVNRDGKHGKVYCRLHDQHGNTTEPLQINSFWNSDAMKRFSFPCEFIVHSIELWIEPSCGVKKCYLQSIEINHCPFPVNRWLKAEEDTQTIPAHIPKYGTALPQDDKNLKNRLEVIEDHQQQFEKVVKVDGFPPLSKNVPQGEEFHDVYAGQLLKNALVGKLEKIGDGIADWLNPFDDNAINKFTDYGQCYDGPFELAPKGDIDWKSDYSFAMQRLVGVNPNVIELCKNLPENFNATAVELEPLLEDSTLDDSLKNNKIFIVNYKILDHLDTPSPLSAPIALFHVNKKGNLAPLAIQLEQTAAAEVHFPTDKPCSWLLAKMLFNVADSNYHETVTHLGFTHLIAESILVSMHHSLAPKHPIKLLLRPHFLYLMPINEAAFKLLVNEGSFFDTSLAIGSKAYTELLKRRFKTWSLGIDGNLPADLKHRGLDDSNVLPGYHYREDGLELYDAIFKYVKDVVDSVYADKDGKFDELKFKMDNEIHNWAKLLLDPLTFNMKNLFNATVKDGFKDLESLIKTVTTIIFICSVQHAAVNFGQYDQYGFPPNYPSIMKTSVVDKKADITESDIVKLLPNYNETMEILTITNTLSMRATQPLGYFEQQFLLTPSALKAIERFQANLGKIAGKIKLRNNERSYPYDILLPSMIPNAISI